MIRFVLFVVLFSCSSLCALHVNADPDSPDDGKGKIKGIVVESASGTPMEFANIAVYNREDSALVTGGITNANGEFQIDNIFYGDYFLEANFIGFDKTIVDGLVLNRENKVQNLGKISLSPAAVAIGEVNVVADKASIEYKLDKKVVNVSQMINAIGGTAVDVLENTPSVQVDIDGEVSVRGSSDFTVLIDGRPSVLSGSDALQQIPSSAIEKIEIITNPSAKYEPDGTAGIINLVMKKNSMKGLNGIVNATAGMNDKYRGDFMLNYRLKKVNLFLGADWRDETYEGSMISEREIYSGDTTEYLLIKGDRDRLRKGHTLKGGVDFFLSDQSTLTLSGELGASDRRTEGGGKTENYTDPATEHVYSITDETSIDESDFYSLSMNFQHKFNDNGHRLEASAFYSNKDGIDDEIEAEMLSNSTFSEIGEYIEKVSTYEEEDESDIRLQVDYTYPFNDKGQFEAGLQSRMYSDNELLEFRDFDEDNDTWIINDDYTSETDFDRDIHAVYTTYSNTYGSFQYMAGLRGELTVREILNSNAESSSSLNRFDLFPTAHMSYALSSKTDLTASYSRRISRPSGRDLDPTPNYYDRYTIRYGNPDLKPEYTNSFEIGGIQRFGEGRSYISADLYRRITHNKIDRTETLGDDEVFYLYTDNFDKDYSTGMEFTGNLAYKKWLTLNASVDLYRYRITGELDGEAFDRKSTNWGGRLNSTFKFSDNSRLQLSAYYRGPSVSAQGESKSMFFSNISYRHEFWDNKLSATLKLRDPISAPHFENETYGDSFYTYSRREREARVLSLTLSYKINNFKEERGNRGEGGDMDMDMGGEY